MAGLPRGDVPKLKLKWAFGFPGELSADGQPTIAGGRVFVGTQSGTVYALSAATGCVHWIVPGGRRGARGGHDRAARAPAESLRRVHRRSCRKRLRARRDYRRADLEEPRRRSSVRPRHRHRRRFTTAASMSASRPARRPPAPLPSTSAARSAAASSCSMRRTERASGRPTRSRSRRADDEEQDRDAAVGAVGCADLVEPGDRRAAERGLRHHRQQLQRPGHRSAATRSWRST